MRLKNYVPKNDYIEACAMLGLYHKVIHNKLPVTERQPKESFYAYEHRVKLAQMAQGYSEDDFIII